jgi:hypothetical protein
MASENCHIRENNKSILKLNREWHNSNRMPKNSILDQHMDGTLNTKRPVDAESFLMK